MVWVEHSVVPIKDAQGKTIGVQGIARDVTDRKMAQEGLQTQARQQ